ncbi:MFS transporter [Brevibacterium marinum]|uniref:MFS family permease n=1 Tax=Brevibacterium marinum TaxID=418643 RepID=A0A846RNZ4_9MICO|nr:MFS transporter [Brevibacterium marinum]NJC55469.1 MFS family permease [Brevibacterium marinum]
MTSSVGVTNERTLSAAIIVIALLGAVIGGVGAPLITSAALELDVPLEAAQWTLTLTLSSGAVTAPVLGRLGAGPYRRQTVLIALGLVTLGGLLTALPATLTVLLIGRGLQGLGLGVTPLLMAVARDNLESDRAERTISTVSVASTVGIGVAYPLMGLLDEAAGLRIAYGLGFLLSLTATLIAWRTVPASDFRRCVPIDLTGAALLGIGVLGLLIAVAQPAVWEPVWLGGAILGIAAAAFAAWTVVERRTPSPLVDLRLFLDSNVLRSNAAMLASGIAMYLLFSLLTRYVQTPADSGYGFGLSGLAAGAALIPFSALGFVAGRITPRLSKSTSPRTTFTVHSVVIVSAMIVFALAAESLTAVLAAMSLLGFGVGGISAIMPRLVLTGVPKSETSSVLAINQIVRSTGFSIGSAVAGLLLAFATHGSGVFPPQSAYSASALWALPLVVLSVAIIAIPRRPVR